MTEVVKKVVKKRVVKSNVAKPTTVKMVNDAGKEAEVHPDEVDNFRKGGFQEVK